MFSSSAPPSQISTSGNISTPAIPVSANSKSATLTPGGNGVNAAPNADLGGRNLTMAYLPNANLSNANLAGTNFTDGYLPGATLTGAVNSVDFTSADLSNANLASAQIFFATLVDTDFHGANLSNALIVSSTVDSADFSNAQLSHAQISSDNISTCNFTSATHRLCHADIDFHVAATLFDRQLPNR